MPTKRTRSRVVAMLAVAALSVAAMSPAMASPPDEIPPAQAENSDEATAAEKTSDAQLIVDANYQFATVEVQEAIAVFLASVEAFTSCMSADPESNEANSDEEATRPYDECEEWTLDEAQTPGHYVSALHIE